jgi:MOSC domain-containing protein YiiM
MGSPGRRLVRKNRGVENLSRELLMAGLDHIRGAPGDRGELLAIVRRPVPGERELLSEATLDDGVGLVGDSWLTRGSSSTPDGSAVPGMQVTVMNARVAELVAGGRQRMPLAGDQLYLDLDLSTDNLPMGSLIRLGHAVLEVSAVPHLGCAKFVERFGADAAQFVNSRLGRQLRLRGVNTRVVVAGAIHLGDMATRGAADDV